MFQPKSRCPCHSAWVIQDEEATAWTGGWTQPVSYLTSALLLPARPGFWITVPQLIFAAGNSMYQTHQLDFFFSTSRVKETLEVRALVLVNQSDLSFTHGSGTRFPTETISCVRAVIRKES